MPGLVGNQTCFLMRRLIWYFILVHAIVSWPTLENKPFALLRRVRFTQHGAFTKKSSLIKHGISF